MRFDALISPEVHRRMVEVAREFRRELTPSEALLWDALRNRRLDGFKFRRQQPIGPFVADFYCDDAALIVELDGPIHRGHRAADQERQRLLESLGLRVLRVAADQVETNMTGVLARIRQTQRENSPHPRPLP